MKNTTFAMALMAGAHLFVSAAVAQTIAPSAQEMIEQLKPTTAGPRLRGLRNLTVESTSSAPTASSDAAAAAMDKPPSGATAAQPPRPSLSLLIQFDFNSAQIRPESQQALLNLANALNATELAAFKFAVEGHTDAKGLPEYNQKLSQQRAEAVQAYLSKNGVAVARLTASGKGASQLANPANPLGAENRRVRIVNLD